MKFFDLIDVPLLDEDRCVPFASYLGVVLACAFIFLAMLIPIHWLSTTFSTTFNQPKAKRIAWYSYCLSHIHAPTSGGVALYCYLNTIPGENNANWYFGATELQVMVLLWTLGYMICDLILIWWAPQQFRDLTSLLIHHVVILITYSMGILYRPVHNLYFMGAFQVQELSNPFLTNRWFLIEIGLGDTTLFVINGILLTVTFVIARLIFSNIVLYRMMMFLPPVVFESYFLMFGYCFAFVFQSLQFYWFAMIVRATLNFMNKKKSAEKAK